MKKIRQLNHNFMQDNFIDIKYPCEYEALTTKYATTTLRYPTLLWYNDCVFVMESVINEKINLRLMLVLRFRKVIKWMTTDIATTNQYPESINHVIF